LKPWYGMSAATDARTASSRDRSLQGTVGPVIIFHEQE
jgi:hypothetical protein